MRKLLLIGVIFAVPHLAHADVITELGAPTVLGQGYNGYEIQYTFAPIVSIRGQITNVQLTFSGYLTPGVGGADIPPGASINGVTVTPEVSLDNSDTNGGTNTIPLPKVSLRGAPETLQYNNVDNISSGATEQFLTISTSAGTDFPADVFSSPSVELVTLFTNPESFSYTGSATFPNENSSRTSGNGILTLAVSYNPVPEPASLAMLGTSLLMLAGWKRSRLSR